MRPKEYRIKELLREKGLDGAIVSSPENFHYVTGFGGHQHTVSRQPGFTLAVMRADDKVPTHLTTMDFEAATFRIKAAGLNFVVDPYDTWVGLKTWDEIAHGAVVPDKTAMESSMDKLVQFMKACDLEDKKVGVELDYLPVPYYKSLTEKFPEALSQFTLRHTDLRNFAYLCKTMVCNATQVTEHFNLVRLFYTAGIDK